MVMSVVAIVGGGWALTAYDRAHFTTMECTVTSAERTSTSSTSRTVSTSSGPFVQIRTSDCGALRLRWMIGQDNVDSIAAELNGGGRFRFKVGEGSMNLMPTVAHVPNGSTTVYGFTRPA